MTITMHRDTSFYAVATLELSGEPSRSWGTEGAEYWSAGAFDEARDHVLLLLFLFLLLLLLLFLLLHLALFPLRTLLRVSIALSFLPPTRTPFSNDRQRGLLRHRGSLLALRRIRADCLPLGLSKRAQTFPFPRTRDSPRWDQDLMWRDLPRRSIYAVDFSPHIPPSPFIFFLSTQITRFISSRTL